jgi:RNA recognition motif-containing protein
MRDPETGNSKGFAFINFASFEASDAAMDAMNGQYLCNRPISVSYAFKKDSKGERHGSAAERLLAAQNPLSHADRPHQLFADAPTPVQPMMPPMMNQMIPPPLIAPNLVPPPPPNQMIPPPPPVPPPHVGKLIICITFIKIDAIDTLIVGPKNLYSKVSFDLKDELKLRAKL